MYRFREFKNIPPRYATILEVKKYIEDRYNIEVMHIETYIDKLTYEFCYSIIYRQQGEDI